jgi:hypothetical protein
MNVSNGEHDFTKVICPYINKCYEKRSSWVEKLETTNKTKSKRKKKLTSKRKGNLLILLPCM